MTANTIVLGSHLFVTSWIASGGNSFIFAFIMAFFVSVPVFMGARKMSFKIGSARFETIRAGIIPPPSPSSPLPWYKWANGLGFGLFLAGITNRYIGMFAWILGAGVAWFYLDDKRKGATPLSKEEEQTAAILPATPENLALEPLEIPLTDKVPFEGPERL